MNPDLLSENKFLPLRSVLKIIPVGRTTWLKGVKTGLFPKPVKFSSRIIVWRAEDIKKLLNKSPSNGKEIELFEKIE